VGHALYPEEGTDAEKLLMEADRAMYAEKQRHHNELYTAIPLATLDCPTAAVN